MFINPYTFVPIDQKQPERKRAEHVSDFEGEEELLTGYVECSLEVKSHVFVPNTTKKFKYLLHDKPKNFHGLEEHYFSEFYSYEDLSAASNSIPAAPPKAPRIPGSEIRGAIRNLYEQLTNSCLPIIDDQNVPSKRTSKPRKAGILDLVTKELFEGERVMLNTRDRSSFGEKVKIKHVNTMTVGYRTGQKVWFQKTGGSYITSSGFNTGTFGAIKISPAKVASLPVNFYEGYVLISNKFPRKHHDSIIIKTGHTPITLNDRDIERFEQTLNMYKSNKANTDYMESYYKEKEAANDKKVGAHYFPVFYLEVGGIYYLSPSMISRDVYSNTIDKILENNHNKHQCCSGKDGEWCPACRLFGMIAKNGEQSIASRLRFTDTEVFQDFTFSKPRLLEILGNPRISSTEFYLEKPNIKNVAVWNYDYYTKWNDIGGRTRVDDGNLYNAVLKGRKVYWLGEDKYVKGVEHRLLLGRLSNLGEKEVEDFIKKCNLKQRQAVRALEKGKTSFKVYFEDITEEELACLLYCLSLKSGNNPNAGDGENSNLLHRIGRGKPYGMGAVKISITDLKIRSYKMQTGDCISVSYDTSKTCDDYFLSKVLTKDQYNGYKNQMSLIEVYSQKLSPEFAKNVSYPKTTNNKEPIYQWFVNNRGGLGKEIIERVLPGIPQNRDFRLENISIKKNVTPKKKS